MSEGGRPPGQGTSSESRERSHILSDSRWWSPVEHCVRVQIATRGLQDWGRKRDQPGRTSGRGRPSLVAGGPTDAGPAHCHHPPGLLCLVWTVLSVPTPAARRARTGGFASILARRLDRPTRPTWTAPVAVPAVRPPGYPPQPRSVRLTCFRLTRPHTERPPVGSSPGTPDASGVHHRGDERGVPPTRRRHCDTPPNDPVVGLPPPATTPPARRSPDQAGPAGEGTGSTGSPA